MSRFFPERQLFFSPQLAASIGLEESILLQYLNELFTHREAQSVRGLDWLSVERQWLADNLPFWREGELLRITRSLADKGLIVLDSAPQRESEYLVFALNEPRRAPPVAQTPAAGQHGQAIDPHWSPAADLLQSLNLNHGIPSAFALQQVEEFVYYWRDRGDCEIAWENKFRQWVLSRWRRREQAVGELQFLPDGGAVPAIHAAVAPPTPIPDDWRPSQEAMDIMLRVDTDPQFIEDAIPEFLLYWRERGETTKTLNSKFVSHIRRQWAIYRHKLTAAAEPFCIDEHWQPDAAVYDILRMAEIDLDYAATLLPEFVLYWRKQNQLHSDWDNKFLRWVKRQWAEIHTLPKDGEHAQQQGTPGGRSTRARSLAENLSDVL